MADKNNDRWTDESQRAGDADYNQRPDRGRGPRKSRYASENRSYEPERGSDRGGYGADGRHDDRYSGGGDVFARDEMIDRLARGEDTSLWSRMFHRDRHEGEHRGRGPKNYTRSDDRIRDDVNDRLTDDSWLDAQDISVEVKASEVTLTGTVRSRDDKRRAETLAESVSGVDHVQNNLRVKRPGDTQQQAVPLTPVV